MSDKNKVATFTIKYETYGSREIPKIFQFVLIFARKILLLLKTLIHHFAKVMSQLVIPTSFVKSLLRVYCRISPTLIYSS